MNALAFKRLGRLQSIRRWLYKSGDLVDKPKRLGYNYHMPTIYRQDSFEVMIYTNDRPAHVYVFKADGEVVIYLGSEIAPPRVRTNIGLGRADERRALIIVGEHDVEFWMEWRRIHG